MQIELKPNEIVIDARDIIINEGIAKAGSKMAGKPYSFAKLNGALSNGRTFVEMFKAKGAKVFNNQGDDQPHTKAEGWQDLEDNE